MPVREPDDELADAECAECPHVGLTRKQSPAPGGPTYRIVCPECGTVHEQKSGGIDADKR